MTRNSTRRLTVASDRLLLSLLLTIVKLECFNLYVILFRRGHRGSPVHFIHKFYYQLSYSFINQVKLATWDTHSISLTLRLILIIPMILYCKLPKRTSGDDGGFSKPRSGFFFPKESLTHPAVHCDAGKSADLSFIFSRRRRRS